MNKARENEELESIYRNLSHGVTEGVLQLTASNVGYDGKKVSVSGIELMNFSSYSYLNLERFPSLVEGCINATREYGTQFGYSRAFVSIDLYDQLEGLLSEIFDAEVVLSPSTTLAHQAAMPVVMNKYDLILIDQYAHASMYYSLKSIRDAGAKVEVIRHNRVDLIQEKLIQNKEKYRKVWYVADGVYSMQGDFAPVKELEKLLKKYCNFHLYIDDAHGMSWMGENGRGYVLNEIDIHPNMVVATSLNKAFAASGGVLIMSSSQLKRKIRTCGGTLIFSTPIQPPMLGCGIASAKLHLSGKLKELQTRLNSNIAFCRKRIKELGLPELSNSNSPIFFLPTSYPKVCYALAKKMMNEGYYLTPTLFPAVSVRRAGIRFCISAQHSIDEIENMLSRLMYHYSITLKEEGVQIESILKHFKLNIPKNYKGIGHNEEKNDFQLESYTSIQFLDKIEWNTYMAQEGMLDYNAMDFLERTYRENKDKENNWSFLYLVIRDKNSNPILITFFTVALVKDDLFKSTDISKEVEEIRRTDPYYLTTESLMMGSLVTEGNHLYLDRSQKDWTRAVHKMLSYIDQYQCDHNINTILLRDFDCLDFELSEKFINHGFVELNLPDYTHILSFEKHQSLDDWWNRLGSKRRLQIKKDVIAFQDQFNIIIKHNVSQNDLTKYISLYRQVKDRSLLVNTFDLPARFFKNINEDKNWEFITISLKENSKLIGVVFSYKTQKSYVPLFLGMEYDYVLSHNLYKQLLYQMIIRGFQLKKEKVNLGITSSLNKRRLGAKAFKKKMFVQTRDSFNSQVLSLVKSEVIK